MFESPWNTVSFSRGLFGRRAQPGLHRENSEAAHAVGQEGQPHHDAVGRHEAAPADRQGALARTLDSVPRRAVGRRRRGAAPGDVADRARPARLRRHRHPHDALHRGSRGDGRPRRRHQQGRDHPDRGQGRADAQARQEGAGAATQRSADRDPRRARSPQAGAVAGRQGAGLLLRHARGAHRHHRAVERHARSRHRLLPISTRRKPRSRTSSSTWCGARK